MEDRRSPFAPVAAVRFQGRDRTARAGHYEERRAPDVPVLGTPGTGGAARGTACADHRLRARDRADHTVGVPPRRQADQDVPNTVEARLPEGRGCTSIRTRPPADGGPESRAGRRTPLRGHEAHGPQDGERVSPLRHCLRGRPCRWSEEAQQPAQDRPVGRRLHPPPSYRADALSTTANTWRIGPLVETLIEKRGLPLITNAAERGFAHLPLARKLLAVHRVPS